MVALCIALLNTNVIFAQMNASSEYSFNDIPSTKNVSYCDLEVSNSEFTNLKDNASVVSDRGGVIIAPDGSSASNDDEKKETLNQCTVSGKVLEVQNIPLSQLNAYTKAIDPDALLSAAIIPEESTCYGQYNKLVKYLDELIPMIYEGNYDTVSPWMASLTCNMVDQSTEEQAGTDILSYQSECNLTPNEDGELLGDVSTTLEKGSPGYAVSPYESIDEGFFEYSSAQVNSAAGENSTHPISFTSSSIKDAASRMKQFIETNQCLPSFITINHQQVSMSEYLYLLVKEVLELNSGSNNLIIYKKIAEPWKAMGDPISGILSKREYLDITSRVLDFMDSYPRAPNYASTTLGRLRFENLVYTWTKVVDYAVTNGRLPNWVAVGIVNLNSTGQETRSVSASSSKVFTLTSIQDAASKLKIFMDTNQRLPSYVTINQKQVTMGQYLYLLLKGVLQINTGSNTTITLKNITEPTKSSGTLQNGILTKTQYLDLAQRLNKFLETNQQAPNYATFNSDRIKYENLINLYTRIVDFYKTNQRLPQSVSIINILSGTIPGNNQSNNPPNSNNSTNFSLSSIKDASSRVKTFMDTNQRLPSYVTINQKQVTMGQYLYLLLKGVLQINTGSNSTITLKNITEPIESSVTMQNVTLTKSQYLGLAQNILQYMEARQQAPNYANFNSIPIKYENLIQLYTKIMNFSKTYNRLPYTASICTDIQASSVDMLTTPYQGESISQHLVSTQNCQVNHTLIQSLSSSLTSGLSSTWAKAEAIFNWVRNNIKYEFYFNTKYGAVNTLLNKSGNCVDHSHLLVALSRAANIPARYVHGNCTFISGTVYGHVWTEILIGDQWYAADATSLSNSLGIINSWNTATAVIRGRYISLPF